MFFPRGSTPIFQECTAKTQERVGSNTVSSAWDTNLCVTQTPHYSTADPCGGPCAPDEEKPQTLSHVPSQVFRNCDRIAHTHRWQCGGYAWCRADHRRELECNATDTCLSTWKTTKFFKARTESMDIHTNLRFFRMVCVLLPLYWFESPLSFQLMTITAWNRCGMLLGTVVWERKWCTRVSVSHVVYKRVWVNVV